MVDYSNILKTNHLKATFQRISILEEIDSYGHISIDHLHHKILTSYPSLSLATVYKNIILMQEKGILTEVPMFNEKSKYELTKDEHIHLVCKQCGDVEDMELESSANLIFDSIIEDKNFELKEKFINLYGVCSDCVS